MKIKLLNDGGYVGLEGVDFPVVIDASKDGILYVIHRKELWKAGADHEVFHIDDDAYWPFPDSSVEVIS